MFNSNVQPKRRIRMRSTPWQCICRNLQGQGAYRINDAHLTRCPDCGTARHNELAAIATTRSGQETTTPAIAVTSS